MICDNLANSAQYENISASVKNGLALLLSTDFSRLDFGKHEAENGIYFFLINGHKACDEKTTAEAHLRYIDIQYMFRGDEIMGWAPLSEMGAPIAANPDGDDFQYRGEMSRLTLKEGSFAVFFPGDVHCPSMSNRIDEAAIRVVVKLPI